MEESPRPRPGGLFSETVGNGLRAVPLRSEYNLCK